MGVAEKPYTRFYEHNHPSDPTTNLILNNALIKLYAYKYNILAKTYSIKIKKALKLTEPKVMQLCLGLPLLSPDNSPCVIHSWGLHGEYHYL